MTAMGPAVARAERSRPASRDVRGSARSYIARGWAPIPCRCDRRIRAAKTGRRNATVSRTSTVPLPLTATSGCCWENRAAESSI